MGRAVPSTVGKGSLADPENMVLLLSSATPREQKEKSSECTIAS